MIFDIFMTQVCCPAPMPCFSCSSMLKKYSLILWTHVYMNSCDDWLNSLLTWLGLNLLLNHAAIVYIAVILDYHCIFSYCLKSHSTWSYSIILKTHALQASSCHTLSLTLAVMPVLAPDTG